MLVCFMWFTLSAQTLGLGTNSAGERNAGGGAGHDALLTKELHSPADFISVHQDICASELEFDLRSRLPQLLLGILIQKIVRQTVGVAGKRHRVLKAKKIVVDCF